MRYSDQIISDCHLVPREQKHSSVFDIFNFTRTAGGSAALENLLTDKKESRDDIVRMQITLQYVTSHIVDLDMSLNNAEINYIQEYFRATIVAREENLGLAIFRRFRSPADPTYNFIRSNVIRLVMFLRDLKKRLILSKKNDAPPLLMGYQDTIDQILGHPDIVSLFEVDIRQARSGFIIKTDLFFRKHFSISFSLLLDALYAVEALVSISKACKKHSLVFPLIGQGPEFNIDSAYHLLLKEPVKNDIILDADKKLVFLTGANMAGKSTLLRTIGTIVCLAHSGFPVPANSATIPFYDYIGICISGQDNIFKGYSHFYNEILGVKELLTALKEKQKCFSIFDEIFSGTNFNDAVDCAAILVEKISSYTDSNIIISSHNIQLAGATAQPHVQYNYIESYIRDEKPVFTYKIKAGKNEIALGLFLFKQLDLDK